MLHRHCCSLGQHVVHGGEGIGRRELDQELRITNRIEEAPEAKGDGCACDRACEEAGKGLARGEREAEERKIGNKGE